MTKPSRVTRIPIDLSAMLSQQRLRCAQIETSQNKSGQRESISTVWALYDQMKGKHSQTLADFSVQLLFDQCISDLSPPILSGDFALPTTVVES